MAHTHRFTYICLLLTLLSVFQLAMHATTASKSHTKAAHKPLIIGGVALASLAIISLVTIIICKHQNTQKQADVQSGSTTSTTTNTQETPTLATELLHPPILLISPQTDRGNRIVGHQSKDKQNLEWSVLLHKNPETNVWSANTESPEEPIEKQLVALNAGTPKKLYTQPEGSLYGGVYVSYEYQKKYRPIWATLQFLHDKTSDEITSAMGGEGIYVSSDSIDPRLCSFIKLHWKAIVAELNQTTANWSAVMQLQ